MSYNRATGVSTEIAKKFDLQVEEAVLSPDGNYVYFIAGERGRLPVYRVPLGGAEPQKMVPNVSAGGLQITPDGKSLVFTNSSIAMPAEIYRADIDAGTVTPLTEREPGVYGAIWFEKSRRSGMDRRPRQEDSRLRSQTAKLRREQKVSACGPDSRRSAKRLERQLELSLEPADIYANNGYIVFAPNPRGSTGYGQQFVNEISGDWGGKAYTDIMNGAADRAAPQFVHR